MEVLELHTDKGQADFLIRQLCDECFATLVDGEFPAREKAVNINLFQPLRDLLV